MVDFAENKPIIQNFYIKYTTLINEFLNYAYENLPKDNSYKYIVSKGIELLTHTFKFNMINTQDITVTIDICHKNYLYYIEFISQISEKNNQLSLTPADAVFFVLKKSVFNILNHNGDDNFYALCPIINDLISFHNILIFHYIDIFDINELRHFNAFNENIYLITEHMLKIHTTNNIKNLISYAKLSKIKNIKFDILTKNLILFMSHISQTYIDNNNIYDIII